MTPLCFVILKRRTEHWNLGPASTSYLQELAVHAVAEARHYYDFNLTVKLQHVDHQHVVVNQGFSAKVFCQQAGVSGYASTSKHVETSCGVWVYLPVSSYTARVPA